MASRSGIRRAVALLALAFAGVGPAAAAHADAGSRPLASSAIQRVAGSGTTTTASGLLRVRPELGSPLLSHGPDPATAAAGASARSAGLNPAAPQRAPACATDYYQHILYGHLSGTPDRLAELRPQVQAAVRQMDAVLNDESLASGGSTADYKVLCDESGEVDVGSFEAAGTSFADVVAGARAAGYRSNVADFLIYFDGNAGGSCGIASYNADDRLTVTNASNSGGGYGLVYEACWFNETPMHESGHLMGAVQYGAPNSTGTGGHCYEENDVMCYSPDGGDLNQGGIVERCSGVARFDCNFDDYFDSAPEPGEYLEGHWNLGSPLNRFISFAGQPSVLGGGAASRKGRAKLGTGGKRQAAAGAAGDWRYFSFEARRHSPLLRVRVFGAPGADLALFASHSKKPTRNVFQCREVVKNRHATCRLRNPKPGRWTAGVLTRGGMPGTGYKISVRNKPERR